MNKEQQKYEKAMEDKRKELLGIYKKCLEEEKYENCPQAGYNDDYYYICRNYTKMHTELLLPFYTKYDREAFEWFIETSEEERDKIKTMARIKSLKRELEELENKL